MGRLRGNLVTKNADNLDMFERLGEETFCEHTGNHSNVGVGKETL